MLRANYIRTGLRPRLNWMNVLSATQISMIFETSSSKGAHDNLYGKIGFIYRTEMGSGAYTRLNDAVQESAMLSFASACRKF